MRQALRPRIVQRLVEAIDGTTIIAGVAEVRQRRSDLYGGVPTALNLTLFRLGQLIGREAAFLDDPDFNAYDGLDTDEQLFRNALFNLEMEARPNVVSALQEYYGGLSGFFVALWNSDKEPRPADYDENRNEYEFARKYLVGQLHVWKPPYQETDDEILNDVTDERMNLWNWLDQGAEPLDRC